MYCLLIRVEAGPEPNAMSYLVTNIVFLVGFFTLAVLLGEATSRLTCSAGLTQALFNTRQHSYGLKNMLSAQARSSVGSVRGWCHATCNHLGSLIGLEAVGRCSAR